MAICGLSKSRNLLARKRLQKRDKARRVLLETLETRQLLTVGPQLLGVQPNTGDLLENGDVLNVSPKELVFRFDDGAGIDASTLDGIRIVRSGDDGVFERASVATDFRSGGQTLVEFYAVDAGEEGNGIQIQFSTVARSDTRLPAVTVDGRTINVELNSNPALETRVEDLLQVFDPSTTTPATRLVTALRLRGSQTIGIASTIDTSRVLTLSGANAAKASTDFGLGNNIEVRLIARDSGNAGLGITLNVTARDRGGAGNPIVTVVGKTINVEINSNARFPTTVQEFVDALNASDSLSSALLEAQLVSGSGATRLGTAPITYSPLSLEGVSDVEIIPAYVGLGDTDREVILRFAEALPDDRYRIEVIGQGLRTLTNVNGEAFNQGVSRAISFELDLGAQIESVVPQPVTRNASGQLTQARNQIDIYFNDDDLIDMRSVTAVNGIAINEFRNLRTPLFLQSTDTITFAAGSTGSRSVLDTSFYQLFHTADSLTNADDTRVLPSSVRYYPDTDRVTLSFSRNLDELTDAGGATLAASDLRLRVGSNEAAPLAPVSVDALTTDPSDTFGNAQDLSASWTPGAGGTQSVIIDGSIQNQTPFELDFPGGSDEPGNRINRYQDNLRLGADTVDGISTVYYNFQGDLGVVSNSNLVNAITETQKERVREVLSLYEQYMGVRFVETESLGMTVAVGDMRAIVPFEDVVGSGDPGVLESNGPGFTLYEAGTLAINGQLATVLDIQDFSDASLNEFAGPFQRAAMQAVGRLLGLGLADEVAPLTIQAFDSIIAPGVGTEIVLPGDADIVHGQYLYRPDSKDIDLYQFSIPVAGRMSIEAFAERMSETSLLDSQIRLYQETPSGWSEIAANDDYYSSDSYLELDLAQGNYIVGVSASGNADYDPTIEDTGIGGRSQGDYQLRMDFQPPATNVLRDGTGTAFDGDMDGAPDGVFNFWFRPSGPSNTKFVDKAAPNGGTGTIAAPYNNINVALTAASPGDVVRIVGNGGADNNLGTVGDNLAYEIGFDNLGRPLPDGATFDVPQDVSVMIDAGAVLKMRRARIGVGSTSVSVDRSAGSLLVLGTPTLLDSAGNPLQNALGQDAVGSVYITSANDGGIGVNANSSVVGSTASPGDWGGLDFRNRVDDTFATREHPEQDGRFLNWVTHADLRFGGGQVVIDGVSQAVTPIQMIDARPTVNFSTIVSSSDAAMSATPNSFLESNFQSPAEQGGTPFSVDYERVGPDLNNNRLTGNSINGLQIRVRTAAGTQLEKLTVQGRFDDTDVVHYIPENLEIEGTAGGVRLANEGPTSTTVEVNAQPGGTLPVFSSFNYVFTSVDASGVESTPSEPTQSVFLGSGTGSVLLSGLPIGINRIYRSAPNGQAPYELVGEFDSNTTTFIDSGGSLGTTLPTNLDRYEARLDARLAIDPGTVVKSQGARIDVDLGAQLIAEGLDGQPVVFTSLVDARYGAGGTFDTANRAGAQSAAPGDWGGIYVGHTSKASLDHAVISYGGGTTRIEGGFSDFNALEVHQGELRLANSRVENNSNGVTTSTDPDRGGRGTNSTAAIFVRGTQPIIVDNIIINNDGPAISANVSALNSQNVNDYGRSTGYGDRYAEGDDNFGPLVALNRLDKNSLNAFVVRGGNLTTEGIWDDTDIVHVVEDEIVVSDHQHFGGLRLASSNDESLVVKLSGAEAGFTATGVPLDNADRIGGSVQVMGTADHPVVLTSLEDCTVGAGFSPSGVHQVDTSGSCVVSTDSIVDVVLLLDDTGSFASTGPTIATVFDQVTALVSSQVPNAQFAYGVTRFEDYATVGGGANDRAFVLNQPVISTDTPQFSEAINAALQRTAPGGGGDGPETAIEGLWQIATGRGFDENGDGDTTDSGLAGQVTTQTNPGAGGDVPAFSTFVPDPTGDPNGPVLAPSGTVGGVGFREEATKRIVILATDIGTAFEPDSVDPYVGVNGVTVPAADITSFGRGTTPRNAGASIQATIDELVANNIEVVGLYGGFGGFGARTMLEGLSTLTGAVDSADNPLVFDVTTTDADDLANTLVNAITGAVTTASPGDWRSVLLDTNSNDRNVAVGQELESTLSDSASANDTPFVAQFLGNLAPHEKAGDENLRLGFQLQGNLAKPGDVDVYSFRANAGTEVWFDIDRTNNSLDSVVELVDANGRTLALSDNSLAEEGDPTLLYASPDMAPQSVNPLRKSATDFYFTSAQGAPKDLNSTNPKDAGLRVRLPGEAGSNNLYHVRVRSSSLQAGDPASNLVDPANLTNGLTKGNYQLQLRLNEVDEVPGSAITYGDIRFATNGLDLVGVPGNSPLLGENSEVEVAADGTQNDTFANAQPLGNLLQTNRQAISVAGSLDDLTDVDWFSFDLAYDRLTPTALREYFATVLDVDYADGIGRPDTSLYVFDSGGRLILGGLGSSIVDDQASPVNGADNSDLSRGSAGGLDPYIGSYELPAGRYFLAVTNSDRVPAALAAFTDPNFADPELRMQPIEGVQLIAEDHVSFQGGSTAIDPITPILFPKAGDFDGTTVYTSENDSIVDFTLGDIALYVSQDTGSELTSVHLVNPFTGEVRGQVGRGGFDVQDIDFRPNGELRGFDRVFETNVGGNVDRDTLADYVNIDPGTGAFTDAGDLGLQTSFINRAPDPDVAADANDGFNVEALTFTVIGGQERGILVGNRPTPLVYEAGQPTSVPYDVSAPFLDANNGNPPGVPGLSRPGPSYFSNVIYEFDENTGAATSAPANDKTNLAVALGAGTAIRDRGYIETRTLDGAGNIVTESSTLEAREVTAPTVNAGPNLIIRDGDQVILRDGGGLATVLEFNLGPQALVNYDPAAGRFVSDGTTFTLDAETYEFDTGNVIVIDALNGTLLSDGTTVGIRNEAGATQVFEFDLNNSLTDSGNIGISYTGTSTQAQLVTALADAINSVAGFDVTAEFNAGSNRLSLVGASLVDPVQVTGTGVSLDGTLGVTAGNVRIPISEASSLQEFISAIQSNLQNDVIASYDSGRLNFSGAVTGNFADLAAAGIFVDLGTDGNVSAGSLPIDILASDTEESVAARIAAAVNDAGIVGLTATVVGDRVRFAGVLISDPGPLSSVGIAPGGIVTGIAMVNGTMFAVSDTGGLYSVSSPISIAGGNVASYVDTSGDLVGIQFSGLVEGPSHVEGGALSDMLFGIDESGTIHAFNTAGELQPIFANGASSIATGLTNANGLTMSSLDFNLWHTTGQRGNDAGHGLPNTPNSSRPNSNGGTSFYFGFESPGANGVGDLSGANSTGLNDSFNFPGGAAGALESAEFSLEGINAGDLPTLYFTYFFESEDASSNLGIGSNANDYMRDSLRVYGSGQDGEWILLATNNENANGSADDEFDVLVTGNPDVQPLFDNAGVWRQARVPLDLFAGQAGVKLRFEFSSNGGFGYGLEGGRGPEIRTVAGSELADGESVVVNGEVFEIEMGPSVVVPGGASITNGDQVTVDGVNYVFTDGSLAVSAPDVPVNFSVGMGADQVAQALFTAIQNAGVVKNTITGLDYTSESNDVIPLAADSGINGESVIVIGSGNIGDNASLADSGEDVDMVAVTLTRGSTLVASIQGTTGLDSYLRAFDAEGRAVLDAFGNPVENNDFGGSSDSQITFTAPDDGTYFIGVSGAGNSNYNSVVPGYASIGSSGDYTLVLDVTRAITVSNAENRVQIAGATSVTASAGSPFSVQGATGTVGTPIFVNADMTAAEVAVAVQDSFARFFANGVNSAYPTNGNTVDLTGLVEYSGFDFVTGLPATTLNDLDPGPFGATTSFVGDAFGAFNTGTNFDGSTNAGRPGALGAQNNAFEGVYLDDFIIGVAGRGEQVMRATITDTTFVEDPQQTLTNPRQGNPEILVGPYQFEIRGGDNYGVPTLTGIDVRETAVSTARTSPGISIKFNDASTIVAGSTFILGDGTRVFTFEMDDVNDGVAVQPGNISVPYSTSVPDPRTGATRPETGEIIAARVRDIINSSAIQAQISVSANLQNNDRTGATDDTLVLIGQASAEVPASIGDVIASSNGGGSNRERPQGQVIINNTKIQNSLNFGVSIASAPRDAVSNAPTPGSPRNTVTINNDRLAPGAVVMNSELIFNVNGGIQVSGDAQFGGVPDAAVPFVRLVNNTIVGGTIGEIDNLTPTIEGGQVFEIGNFAFADAVASYTPNFGGGPTAGAGFNDPTQALLAPNFSGSGEPQADENIVSLGRGGRMVLEFTNNFLTGSNDADPDLMIFEVGDSEEVIVEVSADGASYTNVGRASAASPTIDIDAFGFDRNSRIAFVRLTDVANQGSVDGESVGADIDAVGAISSIAAERATPGGEGIAISNNATATLLNNVLLNNSTGITVDASSSSTVIGGTVYQRNTSNVGGSATLGQFPTVLGDNVPTFVSAGNANLYPAPASPVIDSSIDSLEDRPSIVSVKRPLGIAESPLLAPQFDINGLLRVDDPAVETPSGLGENVFKDRGTQDRADFVGPDVILRNPVDNDINGLDGNPDPTIVELTSITLDYFDLQITDGREPSNPGSGTGVDDSTVSSASVLVFRNNQPLVEGVDYRFGYDSTNGIIRLTPLAGIWQSESVYTIRFVNSDETSVVALPSSSYSDGDQLTLIDANGSQTIFEIDLGYLVSIPTVNGTDADLTDGTTFTMDDGTQRFTFELDTNSAVTPGNLPVSIGQFPTLESAGRAIVSAIANSGLAASAREVTPGTVQIQGSSLIQFVPGSSGLLASGESGVQTVFGLQIPTEAGAPVGLSDGQTFTIDRSGSPVSFEIDSNGAVLPDNIPVQFAANATVDEIGAALVAAIDGAGLGLSPAYDGNGLVRLGGDTNTRLDLTLTDLVQTGVPGEPASVSVPLNSGIPATEVATVLKSIIEAQGLTGITITQFGSRLLIDGTSGISGIGANDISAILDRAGNPLKPNQADGTTTLTVFLGEGLDYGDAPAPYTSTAADNGPRHTVVSGLSLGATATPDPDAKLVNADEDDGLVITTSVFAAFEASAQISVTNTTGSTAYVSMWLDYNGDGVFASTEQVVNTQAFNTTSVSMISFRVPPSAIAGDTYARVRVSTDAAAVASPVGPASDGEVEDHLVALQGNPFTNGTNNLDVSGDGFVSPIDVLQVVNYLNDPTNPAELTLPAPGVPPYLDVNGDGFVTAIDALLVINHINNGGSGEGEFSGRETVLSSDWADGLGTPTVRRTHVNDLAMLENEDDDLLGSDQPASTSLHDQLLDEMFS